MAFWKKFYKSKYTGAEIDAAVAKAGDLSKVTANPTLAGTETALTGLEVGETKYKVEQPINVVANPTLAGTEAALEGLQVGNTKYKVPIYIIEAVTENFTSFTCTESYSDVAALSTNHNVFVHLRYYNSTYQVYADYGYFTAGVGKGDDISFNNISKLHFMGANTYEIDDIELAFASDNTKNVFRAQYNFTVTPEV